MPSYVPGASDNSQCLENGYSPPDYNGVEDVFDCTYIDPNPIGSLNDLGHNYFLSNNPYKLISYAVFGEAYYNLTEKLKVTAGLRWTVDKKEAPRIPSWVLAANTVGYPVAEVIEQEWREPTGRLAVDWKPDFAFTDDTLLYASYSHGYKAGGANPPANGLVLYDVNDLADQQLAYANFAIQQAATAPRTFDPEFVNAFEVGAKNTLLDGRLTLNTDAFFYDYKGYQISQIVNRSAVNLNFDATVWGLELETDWRPLENLKLGLKAGFEKTRMADGSRAVDLMDRTAGNPAWYVTGPFPTLAANCILPVSTVVQPGGLAVIPSATGGIIGPCEVAYVLGLDPLTAAEYQPNPPQPPTGTIAGPWYPGYPGFDPKTAPNNGAGFYKDLSGNELPNAPHMTATITADYTLPLPNNWLATLHTDLYYQSEAWTRVFNTPGYDKLKAYSNINVAAIFTNEDAGWKVMAYVKNVLDRDSITGAFLNSDDTGLTTNVFLNEPRLYGLRVTKDFEGGPWWTGANLAHDGPFPFTVEITGQVQHFDAPYEALRPPLMTDLPAYLQNTDVVQNRDLDKGDGRSLRLIYQPEGSSWKVSAGIRYGRANGDDNRVHTEVYTKHQVCGVDPEFFTQYGFPSGYFADMICDPESAKYNADASNFETTDWSDAASRSREEHMIVDFTVGHDVGLGALFSRAEVAAGLRYAEFDSTTDLKTAALGNWDIPPGWSSMLVTHETFGSQMAARREFKGAGPVVSWAAAVPVLGNEKSGRLELDWSVTGGALFGERTTSVKQSAHHETRGEISEGDDASWPQAVIGTPDVVDASYKRSNSGTVPLVDLSLGLSYEVGRIELGTGYRWERYFDVLDVGQDEAKKADRTIDGPYFKIAVGFGG
jgi:outer membrane receptor protein involved in Fe transport